METSVLKALAELGSAGAVIVSVWLFLRFLNEERADRTREREQTYATLQDLTQAIRSLTARLHEGFCLYKHEEDKP